MNYSKIYFLKITFSPDSTCLLNTELASLFHYMVYVFRWWTVLMEPLGVLRKFISSNRENRKFSHFHKFPI